MSPILMSLNPSTLRPDVDVEQDAGDDVGHQHDGRDVEAHAEILAQDQADLVHEEHQQHEAEHAEGREVVEHVGIDFPAALFAFTLKEEGLGGVGSISREFRG